LAGVLTQALQYARDLAGLRRDRRGLRKRIADRGAVPRVLVADGDPAQRALLVATLAPETFAVIEARTGAAALDLIHQYHPALALIDQHLPDPDGLAVCARIRRNPALSETRVIVLTDRLGAEPEARAAGADRSLPKPFSPLHLLDTVDLLLGN
jgi:DNA-binding response OmpR family regulator